MTRITISHSVLPLDPPERVAAHVGAMAAACCDAAETVGPTGRRP